jgi:hypothetical protein
MSEAEQGKRFSHVYMVVEGFLKDSEKARFRLSRAAEKYFPAATTMHTTYTRSRSFDYQKAAISAIESEIGVQFRTRASTGHLIANWEWFFKKISVTEMLDSITILSQCLRSNESKNEVRFIEQVKKIFREERLAFSIDSLGGVHPHIDSAFSASHASAIFALSGERYVATSASVDGIDKCLLQDPPDYIGAIRGIFSANENLFKLMYNVPRLDARSAGDKLLKDVQSIYSGHPTMQSVSTKSIDGFKQWIDAAHFYRHEQGVSEPNQPAEEVAILMVSQGLSYVRWLANIDQKKV